MSKRKSDAQVFLFALIVCVACSVILAGAATFLQPLQKANIKLDILKNILIAVKHQPEHVIRAYGPDECIAQYRENFEMLLVDQSNQKADQEFMRTELAKLGYDEEMLAKQETDDLLSMFMGRLRILAAKAGKSVKEYDPQYKLVHIYKPGGKVKAYVVPIEGLGLWDLIKGYLALEPDLNTVKGITFYEQKETAGLGAEIVEDFFTSQYVGKKILDDQGNLVGVTVARGKYLGGDPEHHVDGISGATLTGNGINIFMMETLENYESFFNSLRQGSKGGNES